MASSRLSLFLVSGLLALAFSQPAMAVRVKGEPSKAATKAAAPITWRSNSFPANGVAKIGFKDLAAERIVKLQKHNDDDSRIKPMQIGIGREASSDALNEMPALKWQVLKSGAKVARVEITSPDAFGVRAGVRTAGLVEGSELRFSGSDASDQIIAKVGGSETKRLVDDRNIYWTPGTDGQTQFVEIYLPKGALAAPVRFDVVAVSHLLVNSRESLINNNKLSGSCNVNVKCRTDALAGAAQTNFVNAENAVAHIRFVVGASTFICSGTLLADNVAATQIPYFMTNNHCIENQTIANTLQFYFNFETTTCGNINTTATLPTPVTGGATLLYTDADTSATSTANGTDTSFLQMTNTPPAGTFFAGWDSAALPNATAIVGIHHPDGDPKKVSLGQTKSISTKLHTVGWTSGTTEGGSSGSGLFTIGGDGAYYLRGGLYRGFAACNNSGDINNVNNVDDYSRFDVAFPSIQQWLAPAAPSNGPTVNHTGAWYNAAESGWGLTWFEYGAPSNNKLGLLFVYNSTGAAPDWYEFVGSWTGVDVQSGNVRKNTGPAFGPTFNPALVNKVVVGTYTLTFTSATTATLSYNINGTIRTNVPITKL
jgi:lysyl endopeptidase